MATLKTIYTVEALRRLHGPEIPNYPGSPHEEEVYLDDAELILHELGHIVQNPRRVSILPANIDGESRAISGYLDRVPAWRSDLHEMRAIAIELVAARKLGIRLCGYRIIENSLRNTKLFYKLTARAYGRTAVHDYWDDRYKQYIARIKKLPSTSRYADIIVAAVDQERHEHSSVPRSPARQPRPTRKAH